MPFLPIEFAETTGSEPAKRRAGDAKGRLQICQTKVNQDTKAALRKEALLQIEAKKAFSRLETGFFPSSIGWPVGKQLFSGEDLMSKKEKPNMATAKKAPAKTAAAKDAAPAKKRTPNAAFMKALTPSPALAAVVGSAPLPRTEIISKLWVYIKANNLQDAANKRNINADAKLKELFGKPQVSMFELAGLIGKHVS
jgi:chromatin remodeling complex protein RSC6